jgi:5-(carboxyamino)imidazole ribonucleotide synthase
MNDGVKLGVLGGGQLARMLSQAGSNMNLDLYFLDSDPDCSVSNLTKNLKIGDVTKYQDVIKFGKNLDVLTIETENVNVDALKFLSKIGVKIFPQPSVIEIIQDKGLQKIFFTNNNIPTSLFEFIYNNEDIESNQLPNAFVLKLRKGGYDGKGVTIIKDKNNIPKITKPHIAEQIIDIAKELAIIGARNENGEVAFFDPVEMVFNPQLNLLDYLVSPAKLTKDQINQLRTITQTILESLNYVGVLAVEFFLTRDNRLLVNEISPRPHNSGHHTIEGSYTSQFEQTLRAVLNLPLGPTNTIADTITINLLGEASQINYMKTLALKGVYLHLYNKIPITGRKIGHITIINPNRIRLFENAKKVKEILNTK